MSAGRPALTVEALERAEALLGLSFDPAQRELMLEGVSARRGAYDALRALPLDNALPPALRFDPRLPGMAFETEQRPPRFSRPAPEARPPDEPLAFCSVLELGRLLRAGELSSRELTAFYLERLARFDPHLRCVVTLTEERALAQAERADAALAAGRDRGPLHGIPWGAKDLLAVRGYPTTWGAAPYREQRIEADATAVTRLEAAGAVLVAKLTTGALAYGDVWFGGQTKSPWDLQVGSSGSSAGPAAAAAGGLVGFSVGSETLGSIVSPCRYCAASGLRPTFGRVSRHGAMALSWSMDKLGPIARTAEDCAAVFDALRGPDGRDPDAVDLPFNWDAQRPLAELRVGVVAKAFEAGGEHRAHHARALGVLRDLGVELVPVVLPDLPWDALRIVLVVEAAAAFDALTRSGRDALLVSQDEDAWPNLFRSARFVPAVEYVQAQRARTLAMRALDEAMRGVDVYACPAEAADNLILTNLTGHPMAVVPDGTPEEEGLPVPALTFTGALYGEADALRVAHAFQQATDFHRAHPAMDYA